MRPTFLPNSLAGRTTLILLIGFALIQALGLGIHTVNQIKLARIEELREVATQDVIIYRHIASTPANQRAASLLSEPIPSGDQITLNNVPPSHDHITTVLPLQARQILRASIVGYGIPPEIRPRGLELRGTTNPQQYIVSFALPDDQGFNPPPPSLPPDEAAPHQPGLAPPAPPSAGERPNYLFHAPQTWLTIITPIRPPRPWRSPEFSAAFIVMSLLGAVMIFWAVQHLLVPVRTLAQAAERLGRDVANAPDLPETGPTELVTAAMAFNTMASRIRRFVEDRTFLITAIGHDLRTPITRLKLRAEYMEDDEQRLKMLADLDEMEAMVSATLAFGRDIAASEGITLIDLPSLLRTILDDVTDGLAEPINALIYQGPDHLTIHARPLSLKRAIVNLVDNALKYGETVEISLTQNDPVTIQIDVKDKGPGIPASDIEAVFEPFRRLETSRNRETGGSGLGLSIARNIIRAHGGDITLLNMSGGGLCARISLPV